MKLSLESTIEADREMRSPRTAQCSDQIDDEIFIVFVHHTECIWLKWLKTGFRHCFTVMHRDDNWITCNSLNDCMEINIVDLPHDFDLPQFYADQGHTVLAGAKFRRKKIHRLLAEFLTCVTVTKRLLGLRSMWIWTPWQLFRFLNNQTAHRGSWRRVHARSEMKVNFQLDI